MKISIFSCHLQKGRVRLRQLKNLIRFRLIWRHIQTETLYLLKIVLFFFTARKFCCNFLHGQSVALFPDNYNIEGSEILNVND